jgi:ABC-type bacteriocin/lantibiotic exporter with double-glycine peptidase domain
MPTPDSGAGIGFVDAFPALKRLGRTRAARRVPVVRQLTDAECGAACLAMILGFYGKAISVEELRGSLGDGRDGTTALSLLNVARHYGLRGRGVSVEIDDLQFLPAGTILHWNFSHFVVLERASGRGIEIVDPATGRRSVPMNELRRSFTGAGLVLEPGDTFEPAAAPRKSAWRYLRDVLGESGLWVRISVISILLQCFALALPILTGALVDRVVPRNDYSLLMVLGGALTAFIVFHFLGSLIRAHLLLHVRTLVDARMTLGFIEHLASLPYGFFQQRSAGDLMMRLNSNANVREIVTAGVLSALLDGGFVTLYLLILFAVSVPLAIVALTLAALQAAVVLVTWRRQRDFMSANLQTQAAAQGYQFEMLTGMETLKAMGVEQAAVDRWSDLFVDVLNVSIARGQLGAVVEATTSALRLGSPLIILGFGGLKVLNGDLSLGTMLAISAVAEGFLTPLSALVTTASQFQLLGSYVERLDDVLDAPAEQDRSKARAAGALRGEIRLEQVSFRFGKAAPLALREVSFAVRPGQHVAIVGRSGAGKSTLARLLVGLYTPESGRLLYDGVDLAELDLRSVRRQFGVMMQQPYLFGGSVRSNIALGNPAMTLSQIVEAAKLAHIHDEIAGMPLGYDTLLASGGASMSGGQRQRLALARVLATRPAILVLDEATNALDAVTEALVHHELRRLQCTTIVVAHRLSTVAAADLILVMDDGVLVEQGSHRELLARNGAYARLIHSQVEGSDRREAESCAVSCRRT